MKARGCTIRSDEAQMLDLLQAGAPRSGGASRYGLVYGKLTARSRVEHVGTFINAEPKEPGP